MAPAWVTTGDGRTAEPRERGYGEPLTTWGFDPPTLAAVGGTFAAVNVRRFSVLLVTATVAMVLGTPETVRVTVPAAVVVAGWTLAVLKALSAQTRLVSEGRAAGSRHAGPRAASAALAQRNVDQTDTEIVEFEVGGDLARGRRRAGRSVAHPRGLNER